MLHCPSIFLLLVVTTLRASYGYNISEKHFVAQKIWKDVSKMWHCIVDKEDELLVPSESNIFFRLYTRKNKNDGELLSLERTNEEEVKEFVRTEKREPFRDKRTTIQSQYFDSTLHTKVLIHGYSETIFDTKMMDIKDVYLSKSPYNVIVVDWGALANNTCYLHAANWVPKVGELVARLLDQLIMSGVPTSTIHVVGFSLGAHVAGFAGKTVKLGVLKRITGLDPALPMFIAKNSVNRLHRTDADYVDIIHTCAGILGIGHRLGHADFYPNDGFHQVGCYDIFCSHGRAPLYYYESVIRPDGFKALKCESWEHFLHKKCEPNSYTFMGDATEDGSYGSYYLRTLNYTPYCMGDDGLIPDGRDF